MEDSAIGDVSKDAGEEDVSMTGEGDSQEGEDGSATHHSEVDIKNMKVVAINCASGFVFHFSIITYR